MTRSGLIAGFAFLLVATAAVASDPFADLRREMVQKQIVERGVKEPGVLRAMREVPRHLFVPAPLTDEAYLDHPLPIGDGQTISQPYIVAYMTSLLKLDGSEKVLEIGTGSGYQAAILARLANEVYTIEIREDLAQRARRTIEALGYSNVRFRVGDGYKGWPEAGPFDGIIVTAAPPEIPEALIDQLRDGGRMVIPVGRYFQDLTLVTKTPKGIVRSEVLPVRFVPMVREQDVD